MGRKWRASLLGLLLVVAGLVAMLAPWRPGAGPESGAIAAVAVVPEETVPIAIVAMPSYAELEQHLARKPEDARSWVLKARLDMQAERYALAAAAYAKALAARSKVPRDAGVWVEYAEALGMAQGGTLVGPAQQPLARALAIDGNHPQALDLAGSAAWEQGDFRSAAMYWRQLLGQLAPGSERHVALTAAIAGAEQRARYTLPSPR